MFDYYHSFKFHFKKRKWIPDGKMVPIYFGEDFSPGTPAKKILTSTLISGHVVAFNSANTFLEISVRGISGPLDFQIPHQGCGHY